MNSLSRLCAAVVLLATIMVASNPASAVDGVTDEFVAGNLRQPTAMDFLADGRAIVVGKVGDIGLLDPATGSFTNYFAIENTAFEGERGILDVLIDSSTNEVFLYRSLKDTSRLVVEAFTFTGNAGTDRGSLRRVWSNPGPLHSAFGTHHLGGSLAFGPGRATIFISIGDGENPGNSQDLTNVFGKVLRINRDGTIPTGNPFDDGNGPNVDEIWAYGLRNPFRMWSSPSGVDVWVGDVGGNDHSVAYEEIHRIGAGSNYGWPLCQGPNNEPKNGPACPAGITEPGFFWEHPKNPSDPFLGAAVAMGEVISGGLPAELEGALIYADYAKGRIRYLTLDGAKNVTSDATLFERPDTFPVWLGRGPDGNIYYITYKADFTASSIRRLKIPGAGVPGPTVGSITATATSGAAPLTTRFSAVAPGSTYSWDFGDGTFSTEANPAKTYARNGTYIVGLSVARDGQTTRAEPITVSVGDVPVATATASAPSFVAGDTLTFSGSASGVAPFTYEWQMLFAHDDHEHPVTVGTGPTFTHVVPTSGHDWQSNTRYRALLKVTDANGLSTQTAVEVQPRKVNVTVSSAAGNSNFTLDGETRSTPAVIDTLIGFQHQLSGPTGSGFSGWSDGGSCTRTFTVPPNDVTLEMQFGTASTVGCAETIEGIRRADDFRPIDSEILRLYQAVFRREPDIAGAKYWIQTEKQGLSLTDMASLFADSQEFRNTYGDGLNNEQFVRLVYRNVLDRQPDSTGLDYWLGTMRQGLPRGGVVRWFSAGQEFAREFPYSKIT